MVVPPESMHVVCIGYMAHLVQGFSWVRKLRLGARTEEDSDRGIHMFLVKHIDIKSKWKQN